MSAATIAGFQSICSFVAFLFLSHSLFRNRKRAKAVRYIKCTVCKNVFCQSCMSTYVLPSYPGEDSEKLLVTDILSFVCLCCRNECCCMFEQCEKDHTHCYTYRRTERRHEKAIMRRYKKVTFYSFLFLLVNSLRKDRVFLLG